MTTMFAFILSTPLTRSQTWVDARRRGEPARDSIAAYQRRQEIAQIAQEVRDDASE